MIAVRPCDISTARLGVARLHRHLRPPLSTLAAFEVLVDGWPVGWALVGRPVSRVLQERGWVEVTRVAVPSVADGGPANGCSAVYGAVARWARRRGSPVLTYTRADESGASLRGAGWVETGRVTPRSWSCASRPRAAHEQIAKVRWSPPWAAK